MSPPPVPIRTFTIIDRIYIAVGVGIGIAIVMLVGAVIIGRII
jgi:hypothetical protein